MKSPGSFLLECETSESITCAESSHQLPVLPRLSEQYLELRLCLL